MKYLKLFTILSIAILLCKCDEVYDYDLNNTTWSVNIFWGGGFYQGEPNEIIFYNDGTTSWGCNWEYTDKLTFKWEMNYQKDSRNYTATYYAQFRKDLTEIEGHCVNNYDPEKVITGSFFGYKLSDDIGE